MDKKNGEKKTKKGSKKGSKKTGRKEEKVFGMTVDLDDDEILNEPLPASSKTQETQDYAVSKPLLPTKLQSSHNALQSPHIVAESHPENISVQRSLIEEESKEQNLNQPPIQKAKDLDKGAQQIIIKAESQEQEKKEQPLIQEAQIENIGTSKQEGNQLIANQNQIEQPIIEQVEQQPVSFKSTKKNSKKGSKKTAKGKSKVQKSKVMEVLINEDEQQQESTKKQEVLINIQQQRNNEQKVGSIVSNIDNAKQISENQNKQQVKESEKENNLEENVNSIQEYLINQKNEGQKRLQQQTPQQNLRQPAKDENREKQLESQKIKDEENVFPESQMQMKVKKSPKKKKSSKSGNIKEKKKVEPVHMNIDVIVEEEDKALTDEKWKIEPIEVNKQVIIDQTPERISDKIDSFDESLDEKKYESSEPDKETIQKPIQQQVEIKQQNIQKEPEMKEQQQQLGMVQNEEKISGSQMQQENQQDQKENLEKEIIEQTIIQIPKKTTKKNKSKKKIVSSVKSKKLPKIQDQIIQYSQEQIIEENKSGPVEEQTEFIKEVKQQQEEFHDFKAPSEELIKQPIEIEKYSQVQPVENDQNEDKAIQKKEDTEQQPLSVPFVKDEQQPEQTTKQILQFNDDEEAQILEIEQKPIQKKTEKKKLTKSKKSKKPIQNIKIEINEKNNIQEEQKKHHFDVVQQKIQNNQVIVIHEQKEETFIKQNVQQIKVQEENSQKVSEELKDQEIIEQKVNLPEQKVNLIEQKPRQPQKIPEKEQSEEQAQILTITVPKKEVKPKKNSKKSQKKIATKKQSKLKKQNIELDIEVQQKPIQSVNFFQSEKKFQAPIEKKQVNIIKEQDEDVFYDMGENKKKQLEQVIQKQESKIEAEVEMEEPQVILSLNVNKAQKKKPQKKQNPKPKPIKPEITQLNKPNQIQPPRNLIKNEQKPDGYNKKQTTKQLLQSLISMVRITNNQYLQTMKERLQMLEQDIRSTKMSRSQIPIVSIPEVQYQHIIKQNIELKNQMKELPQQLQNGLQECGLQFGV